MRQVGTGKASVSEPLMTCRNKQLTSEPDRLNGSGMSLAGDPFTGQAVSGPGRRTAERAGEATAERIG